VATPVLSYPEAPQHLSFQQTDQSNAVIVSWPRPAPVRKWTLVGYTLTAFKQNLNSPSVTPGPFTILAADHSVTATGLTENGTYTFSLTTKYEMTGTSTLISFTTPGSLNFVSH
jgi:hypothetical protein